METVYYTCLNNDCEKHRNIFVEGDPDHAECERERLYLEGQEQPARFPTWVLIALPALLGLGAAAFFMYRRMTQATAGEPAELRENGRAQSWNAEHSETDERRGHAVPPPIA